MDFKDFFAALNIGIRHLNLTVKTTRTQQSFIQYVRTVCRRDNNDTFIAFKAVHLDEELVQSLLTFFVTTRCANTAVTANGVNLIDKDDARRLLARFGEHLADTRGTDTDEHFDKV